MAQRLTPLSKYDTVVPLLDRPISRTPRVLELPHLDDFQAYFVLHHHNQGYPLKVVAVSSLSSKCRAISCPTPACPFHIIAQQLPPARSIEVFGIGEHNHSASMEKNRPFDYRPCMPYDLQESLLAMPKSSRNKASYDVDKLLASYGFELNRVARQSLNAWKVSKTSA
jgi:hypothetical protein